MIRISVDFNRMEDDHTVVLPERTPAEALIPGARVILYELGDIECEAIVRRGRTDGWVADIVKGTIRDPVPEDDGEDSGMDPSPQKTG